MLNTINWGHYLPLFRLGCVIYITSYVCEIASTDSLATDTVLGKPEMQYKFNQLGSSAISFKLLSLLSLALADKNCTLS